MTDLKIVSDESGSTPTGPAPVSDALHAASLLVADVPHNRSSNGADVLPVRLAGRSLTAALSHSSGDRSTGRGSHSTTGEPGAAGAPPHPFSKSRAASRPGLTAPAPSQTNPAMEVLTVSHVPEVLEAEAAAVRKMIDAYDKAIGQLTMARDDARHMLIKIEGRLRDSTPPGRDRYVSPLGDRRERGVPCSMCGQSTFALDGLCETCHDKAQGYKSDGAA